MDQSEITHVNGILLLYHRPVLRRDAATIVEHIEALPRYSRFRVWTLNTELGFPRELARLRFTIVVLHYSLIGGGWYFFTKQFLAYLDACASSHKIAFFQDEFRFCRGRFAFLNRYKVDCVYTLVEPEYFHDTYLKYTNVPKIIYNLPGYVSESLMEAVRKYWKPDNKRTVDIGYRGRPLEFYMGKGAQEKCGIATGFLERAKGLNLKLDIACTEKKRLYGNDWYRFTANCRGFLGVEAGVSIFDVEDRVRDECTKLLADNPRMTFDEIYNRVLAPWEDRIPYRTISPRHFEAAAFRVCQILFEGNYSGILKPMAHYIPLKKDFSNFDEVMRLFSDPGVRHELTENTYRDLIASGRYSYQRFIESFDEELGKSGLKPGPVGKDQHVSASLEAGVLYRKVKATALGLRHYAHILPTPVRKLMRPIIRRVLYKDTVFDSGEE